MDYGNGSTAGPADLPAVDGVDDPQPAGKAADYRPVRRYHSAVHRSHTPQGTQEVIDNGKLTIMV